MLLFGFWAEILDTLFLNPEFCVLINFQANLPAKKKNICFKVITQHKFFYLKFDWNVNENSVQYLDQSQ